MLNPFFTLNQKLTSWLNAPEKELSISGVNYQQWIFLQKILGEQKCNFIYVSPTLEESENFYDLAKNSLKNRNYVLPGLENSPYSGIISSVRNLFFRFHALENILRSTDADNPINLFCTYEAFLQKLPPVEFFETHQFTLKVDDIVSPNDLSHKLVELGYVRSITVEEPGSFAIKGEIFDIYPVSSPPIRIHYFDELIEEIFYIDIQTNKTQKDVKLAEVLIGCTPYKLCTPEFSTQLRAKLPMPSTAHKNKYELRKSILQNVNNNQSFENFASYVPLFFEKYSTISHFFKKRKTIVFFVNPDQSENTFSEFMESMVTEYEMHQNDKDSDCILPSKENFYFSASDLALNNPKIKMSSVGLNQDHENLIDVSFKPFSSFVFNNSNLFEYIKNIFHYIKRDFESDGEIYFTYKNSNSLNELNFLIESNEIKPEIRKRIQFVQFNLDKSFLFESEKILVLSDSDFFSSKIKKTKSTGKSNMDLFAEQLSTLKKGDYIIHSEHGIGQYLGLDTIEAGGIKSDFLTLLYDGNDKIYVPVYKMNLIQKYADNTTVVKLNNLNTKKFESAKERAKLSAKTLAFDLIKLQAERHSSKAFAFSPPDHLFQEFELAFPYEETVDQANAIHDVIEDLQKSTSMDRLVCGDVGFGKTEVAMRAAFKVVLDKKQVAILVPTTILALQHYNSFKARFKNFAVNIEFVSRFKTAQETKEILENVKSGKIDILIGTHKLLGSEMSFYDLGLVIIDEEQRFGVNHKEKLKLLRANVHFLTLTATPIPRTLQLAFLGLKDLSLIKTAPPNRQSIKTYIVKEDDQTLKNALEKELNRGGQVFFVHNRVQDIEIVAAKIKQLVPTASIVVAHGQMTEKELERRMEDFYIGKYKILVSTTIIESGIDIANANTLIVNRTNTFGLSQLHQLRGRIGRSDRKAYAYFLIPKFGELSEISKKRLESLQTHAEIGSGFSIANSDLEIRGAGDILGAEQSGHIENIGLELYMQLLEEAIFELKGEKRIINHNIEISIPEPAYIPNNYIEDSGTRLKYYKQMSNCNSFEELTNIKDSLIDIFGPFSDEIKNLFYILETRIYLLKTGIKSVKLSSQSISLKFDKKILDENEQLKSKVITMFVNRPKVYQITPDYSVIYKPKNGANKKELLDFSKLIAEEIVPC